MLQNNKSAKIKFDHWKVQTTYAICVPIAGTCRNLQPSSAYVIPLFLARQLLPCDDLW